MLSFALTSLLQVWLCTSTAFACAFSICAKWLNQFSSEDPIRYGSAYAQAAIINPSFLQLAFDTGFKVTKDFGETILDILFRKTEWSPEDRVAVLEVGLY